MRNTFFSLLSLSPLFFAVSLPGSICYAEPSDMPVPFAALGQENAVSAEFLKLYLENPQNATIPTDILAILQNQDSLEPPTIVHKAKSASVSDTLFQNSDPRTKAVSYPHIPAHSSPNLPLINEIAKDPKLLQQIPLDELNKLILDSTDTGNMAGIPVSGQNMQANLLSSPQINPLSSPVLPASLIQKNVTPPNVSNLQNFRLIAAKQQVTDANPHAANSTEATGATAAEAAPKNVNKAETTSVENALVGIKIDELEAKLAQGDKEAPFTLAYAYFNGIGGQKNSKRAFELMENLARQGNTRAMIELGKMYEADTPDYNSMRSAGYYKQAADSGDINGKYHLGLLYYKQKFGQGEEALKQAYYTFKEAAKEGHTPSMYELATMYEKGAGFPKDMGQAVDLYRKSAHLGYAPSQMQVGLLYENGILVPKNETLAAAWYTKAAEQGFPAAQYLLAGMYRQGRGIPQNLKQAELLYESAAKTGLVDAQYDLGIFYLLKTEFQDYQKAEYWLQKAADQNDLQAREILLQVQQKQASPKK